MKIDLSTYATNIKVNIPKWDLDGHAYHDQMNYPSENIVHYEYKTCSGKKGTTSIKEDIYFDHLCQVNRHRIVDKAIPIIIGDKSFYTTSYGLSQTDLTFHSRKISKFSSIFVCGAFNFSEHSGIGMGTPKVFKKPIGPAFGIEIELCFPCLQPEQWGECLAKKLNFCNWIADNYPDFITERDGSLEDACQNKLHYSKDHNVELVSPPLPYEKLVDNINNIIGYLLENGADIPGDWYGIHITSNIFKKVGKSATKFVSTVNSAEYRPFFSKASGREGSHYLSKYAPFVNILTEEHIVSDLFHNGHYCATYPRNIHGGAIELRIFQAKLDKSYICAILELTKVLSEFSMSIKPSWAEFLIANMSSNLKEHLTYTGALQSLPV